MSLGTRVAYALRDNLAREARWKEGLLKRLRFLVTAVRNEGQVSLRLFRYPTGGHVEDDCQSEHDSAHDVLVGDVDPHQVHAVGE